MWNSASTVIFTRSCDWSSWIYFVASQSFPQTFLQNLSFSLRLGLLLPPSWSFSFLRNFPNIYYLCRTYNSWTVFQKLTVFIANQIPTLYVTRSFVAVFKSLTLGYVWASWIQAISRNAPSLQDENIASHLCRSCVCSLLSNLLH